MVASSSSNSWILALKVLLITAVGVSVAVTAKLAVPVMFDFALNDLPAIWSSWLQPPYLYVIINGIIVIIVVSTRLQQTNHHQENQSQLPPLDLTSDLPPASIHKTFGVIELPPVCYDFNPSVTAEPPVDLDQVDSLAVGGIEDDFSSTRSMWINPSQSLVESPPLPKKVLPEFSFPVKEKQRLVTFRFAHNRKPSKNIPEGVRGLRVLKPKKHETLDSTWKMITEGRRMPPTRQFRKSDTFENLHYDLPSDESTAAAIAKVVKKSETLKDRTVFENQNHYTQPLIKNNSPDSAGNLKKDLSLSQDELNRRVEAFIKKFNDDMRMQRQESLTRYMEMVDRGPASKKKEF
ncbi:hypothetical protein SSX86_016707 [Deinandra increscens subsp. villosa]|uniref:DUF4408 domain-containing protein n=1 Tax=Deinandra increscens subsp. villosa TaxID=3103831 RepID=A0AAP0GYB5_9ASTR